ncbi:hypothetical protein LZ30DRAFT_235083 [Colletotrichum cereale]|nr:hypothetical protein LZ30DRAFT_235083 [Colletotrichum cereale]
MWQRAAFFASLLAFSQGQMIYLSSTSLDWFTSHSCPTLLVHDRPSDHDDSLTWWTMSFGSRGGPLSTGRCRCDNYKSSEINRMETFPSHWVCRPNLNNPPPLKHPMFGSFLRLLQVVSIQAEIVAVIVNPMLLPRNLQYCHTPHAIET